MNQTAQDKAALRRNMAQLPRPNGADLIQGFLALPQLRAAGTVLLFCGVGNEIDTLPLIEQLLGQGKVVCLPKCLPGRRMQALQITALTDLRPGAYGIPEPGEDCAVVERDIIELILVPNLCCDRQGFRLGHGGGYYDRYLMGYTGFTVALCPQDRLQDRLPRDAYDIPMELVLTETQVWRGANAPRHTRQ